jgi:hypothetical protein
MKQHRLTDRKSGTPRVAPSAATLFLSLGAGMRALLCSQQVSARNPEPEPAKIRLSNLSSLSPGVYQRKCDGNPKF